MRASSAGGGVPSGGRGAGRGGRRWVTSSGGGGEGPRADESEPGVARDTGRHGCSLPVDGPKTQTECPGGRRGRRGTAARRGVGRTPGHASRSLSRAASGTRAGAVPRSRGVRGGGRSPVSHQRGEEAAQRLLVGRRVGVPHGARAGRRATVWRVTRSGRRAARRRERAPGGDRVVGAVHQQGRHRERGRGGRRSSRRSPCSPVRPWAARTASGSRKPGVRRAPARARSVTSQSRTGESSTSPEMRSRRAEWAAACSAMVAPVDQPCRMTRRRAVAHGVADGRVQVAPLGLAEVVQAVRGAGGAEVAAVGEVEHGEAVAVQEVHDVHGVLAGGAQAVHGDDPGVADAGHEPGGQRAQFAGDVDVGVVQAERRPRGRRCAGFGA